MKLETVNAFLVADFPDADRADGVVRCAKKVLVDSTRWLARSRTYSWALLQEQVGGVSASINATPETRDEALAAFGAEISPRLTSEPSEPQNLSLSAGRGLKPEELSAVGPFLVPDGSAFAAGVVACAEIAADGLDSKKVGIEFDGNAPELTAALEKAGAEVVAVGKDALSISADVLLFGSKPSLIDHDLIVDLEHSILIPTGELSLTPRALAVGQRAGKTILADFLTTAGDRAARGGKDPAGTLAEAAQASMSHPEGAVMGACVAAEKYLATWADIPFGRPLG